MSVRVPPSGTRGFRFPRVMSRMANRMMLRQFRRGGATTQGGIATLMLETTGARSGQKRQAVLGYLPVGNDDAWLVVPALAGSRQHPAWLYNLAAQPEALVRFEDGRAYRVVAETLESADLDRAWARFAREAPEFPEYRSKTDREIPIVRLRRSSPQI
jgi:deazaflavin-dependent oxidoreductase (nitroreductase family)